MCTRFRSGIANAIFAGLMLGLLATLPIVADAQPEQGQLRISLIIPERAAIVAPAIELTRQGALRLCSTLHGDALREIHH